MIFKAINLMEYVYKTSSHTFKFDDFTRPINVYDNIKKNEITFESQKIVKKWSEARLKPIKKVIILKNKRKHQLILLSFMMYEKIFFF